MKTALIIEDNTDSMERITFILDIQLPDMDGLEVLRKIRGSDVDGKIPVIAMTSYAKAGDREELLAAGCAGYIEKPIDPDKVVRQIRRILGEGS